MDQSPPLPTRRTSTGSLHMNYYHAELKGIEEVKSLMIDYLGKDGAFLIRNSFSKPGCLTVSVMHENGIKHFNLAKTATEFYVQDVKFSTIEALVEYYGKHDVPNQEGIKHVRLKYPIFQRSILRQQQNLSSPCSGSSGTLSFHSNNNSPALIRSVSTLPRNLSRHGSNSSMSTVGSDSGMRRNTVGTPIRSVALPIPQTSPTSCSRTSPKHRKTFMGKFVFPFKKRTSSDESEHKQEDPSSNRTRTNSESSIAIDSRPALPLPEVPSGNRQESINSGGSEIPQYDLVRDVAQDRASDLIQTLKKVESYDPAAEQCECGLSFEESELPRGWSMHISHERMTNGRLFFMGPNQDTAWNLPIDVSLDLSADQQDRIRDLLSKPPLPQDQGFSGAVNESLQPASMPSSPPERPNVNQQLHNPVSFQLHSVRGEESDGGTSSLHQVQLHRQPTQHNEHTGSTGSSSLSLMLN